MKVPILENSLLERIALKLKRIFYAPFQSLCLGKICTYVRIEDVPPYSDVMYY